MDALRDTAWFAGFVDGEGCFSCLGDHRPRLSIALRIDDLAVLEEIRATFGGGISFRDKKGSRPQASWHVTSKRDLVRLVEYFDQHPLRAKKAKDYAIWRRMVLTYCAQGRRAGGRQLALLHEALVAVKAYGSGEVEVPPDPQLSLIEGGLP